MPSQKTSRRFVLTLIGNDRPGIVDTIARKVTESGGNWMESRMIELGGQFAGLVQVEVPAHTFETVYKDLKDLELSGLNLSLVESSSTQASAPEMVEIRLEIVSPDRAGILSEITSIIAKQGVSIEELDTELTAAPWSGELLFKATLKLRAAKDQPTDQLIDALEDASVGMMLDLSVSTS